MLCGWSRFAAMARGLGGQAPALGEVAEVGQGPGGDGATSTPPGHRHPEFSCTLSASGAEGRRRIRRVAQRDRSLARFDGPPELAGAVVGEGERGGGDGLARVVLQARGDAHRALPCSTAAAKSPRSVNALHRNDAMAPWRRSSPRLAARRSASSSTSSICRYSPSGLRAWRSSRRRSMACSIRSLVEGRWSSATRPAGSTPPPRDARTG